MKYAKYANNGTEVPMDAMQGGPSGDPEKETVPPIEYTIFRLRKELESPETSDLDRMLIGKMLDRIETLRGEYMRDGSYPKVWKLLGNLDLGGPDTFNSDNTQGTFNPAAESSFGATTRKPYGQQ